MAEKISSRLLDSLGRGDFKQAEELLTLKSPDNRQDKQLVREAISQANGHYGNLPLHVATNNYPFETYANTSTGTIKAAFRVVKLLLELRPATGASKNRLGETPLHFAARRSQVPFEIINIILETRPENIKETTNNGDLPIHKAVTGHREWKEVKILLEKYPDSIRAKNNNGSTLLHCALTSPSSCSCETADELISMSQELTKETDERGELPIHRIMTESWNSYSPSSVKELLEKLIKAYPEGVKHKNIHGHLPIHKAAASGLGGAAILLAKEYPQSLYGSPSPINFYFKSGSFPQYRIRVVNELLSLSIENSTPMMSETLQSIKNERNGLQISLQSAEEAKKNLQSKVMSIEQEKENLQNNVTSINKEREEIKNSLCIVMKTETETRKSEQVLISLLGKAENDESVPVSVEKLKSIANSLNDRIANFKSKVEPNCKQSSAEFFFSCFIKNKDLSKLLLVQAITALNKELVEVEKTFYDGIDKSSNFRNSEDNENVNIENNPEENVSTTLLSSETSERGTEPATKRPRVSLSPQSSQNQNEESEIPAEIEIPVEI